jgi:hypothetical protein
LLFGKWAAPNQLSFVDLVRLLTEAATGHRK